MKPPTFARLARLARSARPLMAALVVALAACAAPPRVPSTPPSGATAQASGDFAALRRCMDNLLLEHGARDLSVIVEDLADPGRHAGAGARDTLVAAVSDMTQRSRAIRLVAPAPSAGSAPLAAAPQFALRGSINLLESPARLGLDLTLLTTQDLSVVPGMVSRNTVGLFDGRIELHKLGARFSVPTVAGTGRAQALRALAEVSSVELFGRLARVPYWTCFGASSADPAIAAEIQDWYDTMAARPAEIIGYFQQQLRVRRHYDGPLDGSVNPAFKEAVARYREALGLAREPKLSLDFFKAYLDADHTRIAAAPAPVPTPAPAVATAYAVAAPAPAPGPLSMSIAAAQEAQRFERGEAVSFTVRPNRDAHVYCYLQDENRRIVRFFPNRFQRDSRVAPAGLQLPGTMRFQIAMNPRGVPETVACFATERDVMVQLPAAASGSDFEPLPMATLEQLRGAFLKAADGSLAQESFQIRPR